jgi:hypothetical protein
MSLFNDASLIVTPNGYKAGKIYSIVPATGAGDLSATRATTATRVNSSGLIESVASNVPRLDYTDGSCPSILVEPQRTNLVLRSEEFENAVWSKTNITVTANTTTAPNGTLTADKLTPSSSDSYVRYLSFNGTAGSVYTFSFYAKADAITNIRIRQFNATELNGTIEFITINNQWQRFTVTSTCAVNQQVQLWVGGGSTWSTGEDIFIWGAQLELGEYPTSYIPTVASTVTRNADVISKTGISDLIGQSEGTMFADFNLSTIGTENGSGIVELTPSGGVSGESNRVIIFKNVSSKQIGFQIRAGGITNIFNSIFSAPPDGKVKVGIAYKSGDTILSVNGSIVARSETFNFSETLNFIKLGSYSAANFSINDTINQVLLFKTRLSNAELISLTTL